MTNEMIERLVAMGCNEWKKHGYHRLYVDIESIGLKISRYNTGNISYAEFDGEKISNCEARRILNGKYYIDVETGKVSIVNGTSGHRSVIKERIEEMVRTAMA